MTDGDVRIRLLDGEDVERVGEIAVAAWAPAYESYREAMGEEHFAARYGDWQEHKASQVESQCRERPDCVRVATVDGTVAGFVTFFADEDTGIGEIGNNAVHPDFQNRGIATTLYRHALAELEARGMEFVEVRTGLGDVYAPARRAYEKVGFDAVRRTVTYAQEL